MAEDVKRMETMGKIIARHTIKDSVFSNLFRDKRYLVQLYKELHPEDAEVTEEELKDITIKNVLTDHLYNDLGFCKGETVFILLEAQAVWTVNIIIRAFLYLAQTYHEYYERTNQNLYGSKKVKMPKPELYVVYTGSRKKIPEEIFLSEEFFGGADTALDVKVKIICENDTDSILNQYIIFSKVYDEQRKKYNRTRKAIIETIRICKDKNVLREYLENCEKEVISIMMSLYDEEEIMRSYIRSKLHEAVSEAEQKKAREKASLMLEKGKITVDEMPVYFPELSEEEMKEIEAKVLQTAELI